LKLKAQRGPIFLTERREMTDIAITGIGIISSIGIGRDAFWENLKTVRSGVKMITSFETDAFRSNVAAWIHDFDPAQFMPFRVYRRMSRISRMAVCASVEALKDSGLSTDIPERERMAVIMGTSYGSSSHVEAFYGSLLKDGPRGAQPFLFPETVPNAPASHIAMFHRITGPNSTFCQNEISAESAILFARNLLLQNTVDVALVGGADELSGIQYSCYDALGVLNRVRVKGDSTPKPQPGGGLILGEGAAVLIMERLDSSLDRKAKIYGILKSGVIAGGIVDIGHYEAEGEQMGRAITSSITLAAIEPEEIDQIDVSANFSGELDRMEYRQLSKIFVERQEDLIVSPIKYLIGDFGGAGALRASAVLLSLYHQWLLPAVKAETLKGDHHQFGKWNLPRPGKTRAILMTSTTFGGGSTSLVFTKMPIML
jgi:3-oxoacyl-[acyl-carrier-protein] synthase II